MTMILMMMRRPRRTIIVKRMAMVKEMKMVLTRIKKRQMRMTIARTDKSRTSGIQLVDIKIFVTTSL